MGRAFQRRRFDCQHDLLELDRHYAYRLAITTWHFGHLQRCSLAPQLADDKHTFSPAQRLRMPSLLYGVTD